MKKEVQEKKLVLKKLSIANLNSGEMWEIHGARGTETCWWTECYPSECDCTMSYCCPTINQGPSCPGNTCLTCGPQSCYTACGITTCKPEYSIVCP